MRLTAARTAARFAARRPAPDARSRRFPANPDYFEAVRRANSLREQAPVPRTVEAG